MTWKHFTRAEFDCKHCGANLMEDDFIDKLDKLRDLFGHSLPVTSGYRCPAHNVAVSTTGPYGPHTTGRAVDFGVDRLRAFMLVSVALGTAEFTGIGMKQHGPVRFVHLDDLRLPAHPRPIVWTYP